MDTRCCTRVHRELANLILAGALLLAAGGCSESSTVPAAPASVIVRPASTLLTEVDGVRTFSAVVTGDGEVVSWRSSRPDVATVDASGRALAVGPGETDIIVEVSGGAADTASLEVWIAEPVADYLPGTIYAGRNGYAEYIPGTLPLILGAPHGGALTPDAEIPDRTLGTTVTDRNTLELTLAVSDALDALVGERPHVILSHLRRTKLDPNREIVEAAQGNVFAEHAWREYHGFITIARERAAADHGDGLFLDMHGHGHAIARVELGYLLSRGNLDLENGALDGLASVSSLRALVATTGTPLSELIRGPWSLGTLMENAGIPAVPSSGTPSPGGDPYFTGGYSTVIHGSRNGGSVSAIQLEHHFPGLRDTEANREAYAEELAAILVAYLERHFGW